MQTLAHHRESETTSYWLSQNAGRWAPTDRNAQMYGARHLTTLFSPAACSFANVLTKKSLADGHRHEPAEPQRVHRPFSPAPRYLRRLFHDEVGLRDTREQAKQKAH